LIRFLLASASAAALILVSTYELLASIPFAYQQFIQSPPFWWMPTFARLQPLILLAALAGLRFAIDRRSDFARRAFRLLTIAACTFAAAFALPIAVPALASFGLSATLCFAPLGVLAWASSIALVESPRGDRRPPTLAAAAIGGLASALAFAVHAAFADAGIAALQPREALVGSLIALAAQLALFVAVCIAVSARNAPAIAAAGIAVLTVLLERCVMSSLMLEEWRAIAVSVALASGLVLFWLAFVSPLPERPRWLTAVCAIAVVVIAIFALPPVLRFADWAFSVQKLLVMTSWIALFVLARTMTRPAARTASAVLLLLIGWIGAVAAMAHGAAAPADGRPIDLSLALERYATVDMSWRALLDVGRPIVSDGAFLSTLREVGDVTYNRALPAVPLRLADDIRVADRPPHLFIVVIDSLRPDYVSAYNPRVTFTPAIGAFARESTVFRNAYTAYSGTGLSEAALWAGALVQRAMYVKPFAAIDNLERLTVAAGYRRYISIDEVMDRILEDPAGLVRLDTDIVHEGRENDAYKLDFCRSVGELSSRLDADRPAQPIFFYTQPKNLHIRVIAGDTPNYGTLRGSDEFFRPAADTIGRLDACFGRFIDYLKAKRLYDDSIVVLTADHGDAYGEEGRWGHAFYVTPETLRIPLVVHLPERLRRDVDTSRVAWLTNLTPTIYDLLGIEPRPHGMLAGRSLLRSTGDEPSDLALVQSSYSRIFGLMDRDARWLYTADANRLTEELFDLTATPPVRRRIGEADRLKYHRWLLDRIGRLNAFYAR